jgi:hypothetical protein
VESAALSWFAELGYAVEPRFLVGARVVNGAVKSRLAALGFALRIDIDPVLFFR